MSKRQDEEYMHLALEEAHLAEAEGEVPVGAVVVADGQVIARAHNRPISLQDPTAHAEVLALRQAARILGNYRLGDCALYVTIEPCPMCAGALVLARVRRLVYGAIDSRAGAVHSCFQITSNPKLNHQVEACGGVLEKECRALLQDFFARRRAEEPAAGREGEE